MFLVILTRLRICAKLHRYELYYIAKVPFTRERNCSTSFRIGPKSGTLKDCVQMRTLMIRKKWNDTQSFRSRLNRPMESMSTERLRSRLTTKQNWNAIVLFPCEQPICLFQKFERRRDGTIAFPCKIGLNLLRHNPQSCDLLSSEPTLSIVTISF